MEKIKILVCEPNKNPETRMIDNDASSIIKILGPFMSMQGISNKFIVYSSTSPGRKVSRSCFSYVVTMPLVVTKLVDGRNASLSDIEIAAFNTELAITCEPHIN